MNTLNEKYIRKIVTETLKRFINQKLASTYENKTIVSEGLTMTYSYPRLKSIISRRYDLEEMGCIMDCVERNKDMDVFTMFKNKANANSKTTRDNESWFETYLFFQFGLKTKYETIIDIIHTMDACGWYFGGLIDTNINTIEKEMNEQVFYKFMRKECKLLFYPKFNQEFKPNSLNLYCYHICPLRNLDKIMKQGLTPRSNGRVVSHPERVYIFINQPKNWKEIACRFRESRKKEKYAFLSVYIGDLIEKGIKFYYDENAMTNNPAVYTLEPIPSNNIKVIDKE